MGRDIYRGSRGAADDAPWLRVVMPPIPTRRGRTPGYLFTFRGVGQHVTRVRIDKYAEELPGPEDEPTYLWSAALGCSCPWGRHNPDSPKKCKHHNLIVEILNNAPLRDELTEAYNDHGQAVLSFITHRPVAGLAADSKGTEGGP